MIEPIGAGPDAVDGPHGTCLPAARDRRARRFLELARRRPLVLDAAMGTRLLDAGLDLRNDDPALWNLTHPLIVYELHRRDASAGCDAIVTNTFGANRFWLARFGRPGAVESINLAALALAREAVGPDRLVLGSIGPAVARQAGAAAEQAAIFAGGGADAVIFETFDFLEIEPVLREVKTSLNAPIPLVVSLWHWPEPPGPAARRLLELGACVVGMNCQPGVQAALAFAAGMQGVVSSPLLVKPSARGGKGPELTPAAFAAAVPGLFARNVGWIGGCCGTTELHVKALADACAACDRVTYPDLTGAAP